MRRSTSPLLLLHAAIAIGLGVRPVAAVENVGVPRGLAPVERAIVVVRDERAARARGTVGDAHARVRDAIVALGAPSGAGARSVGSPLRYEYRVVLNGFAVELSRAGQAELRRHPDVRGVYPDRPVHAALDSSVPAADVPRLWSTFGYRGAGQVIAIIDSGVDYTHPDLGGCFGAGCKVVGGYDFVNGDGDPQDDFGHGTHVAAIAAGGGKVPGVAPEASVLAYKVLDALGGGSESNVIAGIERAADPDGDGDPSDHAGVINLSIGAAPVGPGDPVVDAIEGATVAGAVVVAAAGNDGPAYYSVGAEGTAPSAITVGATTDDGTLRPSSGRGPSLGFFDVKPEIVAPGTDVCAARASKGAFPADCRDRRHVSLTGTSMAAPHVAGTAALLRGLHPDYGPRDVKALIVTYSIPTALSVMDAGAGRLDAFAAASGHTVLNPPLLSFGQVDLRAAVWTAMRTVAARNVGSTARSYAASVSELPAGVTVACTPSTFTLAPGGSTALGCVLTVDTLAVPSPPAPSVIEGVVRLDTAGGALRIPFAFVKSTGLRVSGVEGEGMSVTVHDREARSDIAYAAPGTPAVFTVPTGTYDVVATFQRPCTSDADCAGGLGTCPGGLCSAGTRVVVREGVEVTNLTDVALDPAEAVHALAFRPVDEHGVGLVTPPFSRVASLVHRASGLGTSVFFDDAADVLPVSDVGASYDVDVAALVANDGGDSYFVADGFSDGVAGDRTLGNRADALTPVDVRYTPAPGEGGVGIQETISFVPPGFVSYAQILRGPSWRTWVSTVANRPRHAFYVVQANGSDPSRFVARLSAALQGDATPGSVSAFMRGEAVEPVYRTTNEFPLNLGPPRWFGRLAVDARGGMRIVAAAGASFDAFPMQGGDVPDGFALAWLQAPTANVSTDMPQSPFFATDAVELLPEPPAGATYGGGPNRFIARGPLYAVGGLAGATEVRLTLDTSQPDPEPPAFRSVTFESDGRLTDTITLGHPLRIAVEVVDASVQSVVVSMRDRQLPASLVAPGHWQCDVDDPCAGTAGGLPIVIDATDAAGNVASQRWSPALACMSPTCGDGRVDPGETCDDGNRVSGDGCNATCTSDERCGNGVRDPGEGCDDGNATSADGCGADCVVEHGCVMPASVCLERLRCLTELSPGFPYYCADAPARALRRIGRFMDRAGTYIARAELRARRCRPATARRFLRALDARLTAATHVVRRQKLPPRCRDGVLGNIVTARRHLTTVEADVEACVVVACP